MANKITNKDTLQGRVESVKSSVGEFHDGALQNTEKLVDFSLETTAKWQKLMGKVLHAGTDMLEMQQDLTLQVLEGVKEQYQSGSNQLKELIGWDLTKARKAAKLKMESLSDTLTETIKGVQVSDDLKEIQGIGPKVEELLNAAGINSLDELANSSAEDIRGILQNASKRYKAMDPSSWIALAQEAVDNRDQK
ncbi:MAG: DUF4332 domain-containing protein [Bacteroidota bacterium]